VIELGPLGRRRLYNFRANRRGYWSLWIFLVLFGISLFSEFVANDKPFLVYYDGGLYVPIFKAYPETDFGGEFKTEADYRDPVVAKQIEEHGWMLWPLIRYNHRTVSCYGRSSATTTARSRGICPSRRPRPRTQTIGWAPTIKPGTW
jgi:microcin C transport system permease protein